MAEDQWLTGAVSVEAALRGGVRDVRAVYVDRARYDQAEARVERLAATQGVPLERAPGETLDGHAAGQAHGGIIALVGPRRLAQLDELLGAPQAVNVLLDGVEDPFNFGQAVRSLYAAGIDGLIVRPRNWLSAVATVSRASAGATEFMPTAAAETADALAAARARAIPIAIAAEDGRPMVEVDLAGPLLLLIGGEKRGVARALRQNADAIVSIPYGRDVGYALGTAGAAAVLAFEILRQRRARG